MEASLLHPVWPNLSNKAAASKLPNFPLSGYYTSFVILVYLCKLLSICLQNIVFDLEKCICLKWTPFIRMKVLSHFLFSLTFPFYDQLIREAIQEQRLESNNGPVLTPLSWNMGELINQPIAIICFAENHWRHWRISPLFTEIPRLWPQKNFTHKGLNWWFGIK